MGVQQLLERRGAVTEDLDQDAEAGLGQPEQDGAKFTNAGTLPPVGEQKPTSSPTSASDRAFGSPAAAGLDRPDPDLDQTKKPNASDDRGASVGSESPSPKSIAEKGTAGAGDKLPFADQIQKSFGRHDVSQIRAHQGGPAIEAAHGLGANAFATGNAVAFGRAPDLHTAAHEAAHVVQQQGGVQLEGGVGESGDTHERHADEVADAVVAGRSAESLLDRVNGGGRSNAAVANAPVQKKDGPYDLGADLVLAVGHITATWAPGKGEAKFQENGVIEGLAQNIIAKLGADKWPATWVKELLFQFRGALLGVKGDLELFENRVWQAYNGKDDNGARMGWISDNSRQHLLEAVGRYRNTGGKLTEGHGIGDARAVTYVDAALRGLEPESAALAYLQQQKFSQEALVAAHNLIQVCRHGWSTDTNAVREQIDQWEDAIAPARANGVITEFRAEQMQAQIDKLRKSYGPRGESAEQRAARVAALGPATNSEAAIRGRLQKVVDDLRYLDDKLRETNYGTLHPWSTGYGDTARDWAQQLPKYEAVLERGQPGEMESWLKSAHFNMRGIGGPRELADYCAGKNEQTLGVMQKIADGVGLIPGVGLPAKLVFSGSVELIKAAENKQTLTQALVKTATIGISGKLGPLLKGSGPGKALLTALLGGASSMANSLATILTDPNTSWSEVPEKINVAMALAVTDAFIEAIVGQAKVLSGEGERAEARNLFIEFAKKFGLDPQIKEVLDKELPLKNEGH